MFLRQKHINPLVCVYGFPMAGTRVRRFPAEQKETEANQDCEIIPTKTYKNAGGLNNNHTFLFNFFPPPYYINRNMYTTTVYEEKPHPISNFSSIFRLLHTHYKGNSEIIQQHSSCFYRISNHIIVSLPIHRLHLRRRHECHQPVPPNNIISKKI